MKSHKICLNAISILKSSSFNIEQSILLNISVTPAISPYYNFDIDCLVKPIVKICLWNGDDHSCCCCVANE